MSPSVARSAEMLGEANSVVVVVAAAAAADSAAVSGKCTRRFAPSAALTPRFLSYPEVTGRSIAVTVSAQCVVRF